jgi:hypothetical protein
MVFGDLPIKNGDFPWQTVRHNQMVFQVQLQEILSQQ